MTDLLSFWARNSCIVLICFSHSQCLNPAPGSFGRTQVNLISFPNIILPSNWWSMSNPKQQSSLLSSCVSELEAGIELMCASVETEEWQQDGYHPLVRKWVESQPFPPSWHPRQMELANTAAQPQPKPWQQCARGNRNPARPIREKNALPSK